MSMQITCRKHSNLTTKEAVREFNNIVRWNFSQITQRRCVVWDPSIGVKGAWDAQHCTTVMIGQDSTTCDCYTFGTFSLIAELVSKPTAKPDATWLMVWKYIGYILSIILLPIFFGGIFLRR